MIPSSHILHGIVRFPSDSGRWDIRETVSCEVCGRESVVDPPCTVTNASGSRVEQHARCVKCKHRWLVSSKPHQEEEPMSAPPPQCPCPCGQPVKPGNKYASKACVGRARQGKPLSPEARANVTAANQRRAQEPVQASFDQAALLVDGIDATLAYGPEVQEAAKQALKVFAQAQDSTIVPATDPYAIVAELARNHEPRLLRIAADLREQMEGAK